MEGYKVMIKLISPRFTISRWSQIESWYDWNMAAEILELWMVKSRKFFFSGVKESSFYTQHFLYSMNRFYDNTVFQICWETFNPSVHMSLKAWIFNCCLMFLPKVCDTEIMHRSNETCRGWKIMCHSNWPSTRMYQELAFDVSCKAMQGRDII